MLTLFRLYSLRRGYGFGVRAALRWAIKKWRADKHARPRGYR